LDVVDVVDVLDVLVFPNAPLLMVPKAVFPAVFAVFALNTSAMLTFAGAVLKGFGAVTAPTRVKVPFFPTYNVSPWVVFLSFSSLLDEVEEDAVVSDFLKTTRSPFNAFFTLMA
jgi:hypothetical protein